MPAALSQEEVAVTCCRHARRPPCFHERLQSPTLASFLFNKSTSHTVSPETHCLRACSSRSSHLSPSESLSNLPRSPRVSPSTGNIGAGSLAFTSLHSVACGAKTFTRNAPRLGYIIGDHHYASLTTRLPACLPPSFPTCFRLLYLCIFLVSLFPSCVSSPKYCGSPASSSSSYLLHPYLRAPSFPTVVTLVVAAEKSTPIHPVSGSDPGRSLLPSDCRGGVCGSGATAGILTAGERSAITRRQRRCSSSLCFPLSTRQHFYSRTSLPLVAPQGCAIVRVFQFPVQRAADRGLFSDFLRRSRPCQCLRDSTLVSPRRWWRRALPCVKAVLIVSSNLSSHIPLSLCKHLYLTKYVSRGSSRDPPVLSISPILTIPELQCISIDYKKLHVGRLQRTLPHKRSCIHHPPQKRRTAAVLLSAAASPLYHIGSLAPERNTELIIPHAAFSTEHSRYCSPDKRTGFFQHPYKPRESFSRQKPTGARVEPGQKKRFTCDLKKKHLQTRERILERSTATLRETRINSLKKITVVREGSAFANKRPVAPSAIARSNSCPSVTTRGSICTSKTGTNPDKINILNHKVSNGLSLHNASNDVNRDNASNDVNPQNASNSVNSSVSSSSSSSSINSSVNDSFSRRVGSIVSNNIGNSTVSTSPRYGGRFPRRSGGSPHEAVEIWRRRVFFVSSAPDSSPSVGSTSSGRDNTRSSGESCGSVDSSSSSGESSIGGHVGSHRECRIGGDSKTDGGHIRDSRNDSRLGGARKKGDRNNCSSRIRNGKKNTNRTCRKASTQNTNGHLFIGNTGESLRQSRTSSSCLRSSAIPPWLFICGGPQLSAQQRWWWWCSVTSSAITPYFSPPRGSSFCRMRLAERQREEAFISTILKSSNRSTSNCNSNNNNSCGKAYSLLTLLPRSPFPNTCSHITWCQTYKGKSIDTRDFRPRELVRSFDLRGSHTVLRAKGGTTSGYLKAALTDACVTTKTTAATAVGKAVTKKLLAGARLMKAAVIEKVATATYDFSSIVAAVRKALGVAKSEGTALTHVGLGCAQVLSMYLLRYSVPTLLPPPLPPVAYLLQGVLLGIFVADSAIYKGKLLDRLAFDMRRESSRRDAHCYTRSKRCLFRRPSFLNFCMRAAAAGLVHSNWLHLLVNLHGIRQLIPMCETLCYHVLFQRRGPTVDISVPVPINNTWGGCSFSGTNWSWFWSFTPTATTNATVAPGNVVPKIYERSLAATAAIFVRRYLMWPLRIEYKRIKKRRHWWWLSLPKFSVPHGPHGREGWWARAAVLLLFTAGCAAGNITSFYLRRWFHMMELIVERQQRQQALKRRLWGGSLPEEEGDLYEDDQLFDVLSDIQDDTTTRNVTSASAATTATASGAQTGSVGEFHVGDNAASMCGDGNNKHRREGEYFSSVPSYPTEDIAERAEEYNANAYRARDAAAAAVGARGEVASSSSFAEEAKAADLIFRQSDRKREDGSLFGEESQGRNIATREELLQSANTSKKRSQGKAVTQREEKAWERQLRLQKMHLEERRHARYTGFTRDRHGDKWALSSSSKGNRDAESSSTAAAEKRWKYLPDVKLSYSVGTAEKNDQNNYGRVHEEVDEDKMIDEDELDEEIIDETSTIVDDRTWCVRTVGCSAGLYSLLGLLVGSGRIGSATKKSIIKQIFKKLITEFFMPTGIDEPGHLGGFIFGYLAAHLLNV